MDTFTGKLALITGGTSGIGYALAEKLVQRGADVAILARHAQMLESSAKSLARHKINDSQKIMTVQADVTQREELGLRLDEFSSQNGIPDIVINSAGVAHPGTFTTLKPEIFDWMMDVNYFGTVNVLKKFVSPMQKRRSGIIVNISSVAGFIGIYGYTAYGASKFAVSGFSDALRSELKPYGIQVSVVFPPDTQTPQLEYESQFKPFITKELSGSAKLMSSDQVAEIILNQVARKKYIIIPGSEGKLLYLLHNLLGSALYPVMDLFIKMAIKKLKLGS